MLRVQLPLAGSQSPWTSQSPFLNESAPSLQVQLKLARLPAASTPRIEAALDAIAAALESEASPAN